MKPIGHFLPLNIIVCKLQQDYSEVGDTNYVGSDVWPEGSKNFYESRWPPRGDIPPPPPQQPQEPTTFGLSNRQDIPRGLNFAVYDPVTKQRTTNIDRNCTATGCCVPKCFAEKGNRVRLFEFKYINLGIVSSPNTITKNSKVCFFVCPSFTSQESNDRRFRTERRAGE